MPADLVRAVNHAHTILSWQENLLTEEMPPEWMWSLDDELEEWFEGVAEARKARYGGSSNGSEPQEAPEMMSNDLAAERRRRRR